MTDKISKDRRSDNMRRIHSKDTKPEMSLRKLVHSLGYRYRLHRKNLPGHPDMVFTSRRKVIFMHGCFWHQHNNGSCKLRHTPKSNKKYWGPKLQRTRERDTTNLKRLEDQGWKCLVIWECELDNTKALIANIKHFLDA